MPHVVKKIFLLIVILLSVFGCKKKEIVNYNIHCNVKHYYTNENVPGILIMLWPVNANFYSKNNVNPLRWTYSDSVRNTFFNLEYNKSLDEGFTLSNEFPQVFDTTLNSCKYEFTLVGFDWGKADQDHILRIKPNGEIELWVNDITWNNINADTIVVQSPYIAEYLTKNPTTIDSVLFYVEPSQYNTFSWSYIKNGVYYQTTLKDIFVPNILTSNFAGVHRKCRYQITF
jgi:hypothetical protein